ncbi:hypothetical protein [Desulfobotulus sp.]|uniref:hypothetical protein n=1 Tax=Desulfobotulus sp. TaxID=1940337 RepID=UPI002A35EAED|nr:hypothetical protein [Desulfobotulus sp.]MDY0164297.1 hypothetical protein [Desulfobotulus sp.]
MHPFMSAGFALLPEAMQSPAAMGMLHAIGMQESRFMHRRQIRGPARGFWQFEKAGVAGVLNHHATAIIIRRILVRLRYGVSVEESHAAIEHNDALACCYARLLLWTIPEPLPGPDEPEKGWRQYLSAWRPGDPRPETWNGYFKEAFRLSREGAWT